MDDGSLTQSLSRSPREWVREEEEEAASQGRTEHVQEIRLDAALGPEVGRGSEQFADRGNGIEAAGGEHLGTVTPKFDRRKEAGQKGVQKEWKPKTETKIEKASSSSST